MKVKELIEALKALERDDLPDTMFDDLTTAFDEDVSIFESKINTHETDNAALTTQISSLKNELYDIGKKLAATTANNDEEKTNETDETVEESEDDLDIDDFFEEVK